MLQQHAGEVAPAVQLPTLVVEQIILHALV